MRCNNGKLTVCKKKTCLEQDTSDLKNVRFSLQARDLHVDIVLQFPSCAGDVQRCSGARRFPLQGNFSADGDFSVWRPLHCLITKLAEVMFMFKGKRLLSMGERDEGRRAAICQNTALAVDYPLTLREVLSVKVAFDVSFERIRTERRNELVAL